MGRDMIQSISVRGFKGIKAIEDLELRRMNVLIGANGAGKSNFLGVFEMLLREKARMANPRHLHCHGRAQFFILAAR